MPVIFSDLGNVLVRFDRRRFAAKLLSLCPHAFAISEVEDIHHHLNEKPEAVGLLEEFERGRIESNEYRKRCIDMLKTVLKPDGTKALLHLGEVFWVAHCDIFDLNLPVREELCSVRNLSPKARLYALSNTDTRRWSFIWAIADVPFEGGLCSFDAGAMKPEEKIFTHALATVKEPAERCFFVDDVPAFVQAASALGICAHHYDPEDPERDQKLQTALRNFLKKCR